MIKSISNKQPLIDHSNSINKPPLIVNITINQSHQLLNINHESSTKINRYSTINQPSINHSSIIHQGNQPFINHHSLVVHQLSIKPLIHQLFINHSSPLIMVRSFDAEVSTVVRYSSFVLEKVIRVRS